ncbi:hypothetical protein ACF6ZU_24165 [Pseudomonas migulae]|jgi:hypothetical protein|uniref:hypothetical protein n=1 Tax=Pseudomonas migulae TaxID=78543 RepID=UPI003711052D
MNRKCLVIGSVLCTSLIFGCVSQADQPFVDIGDRHGNLRSAQEHIVQAWRMVGEAQRDNNSHLGGHAERAKELLSQANEELRAAADFANEHER